MPAIKKPNFQDLARQFITATIQGSRSFGSDRLIIPGEHMLFHENEQLFYAYDEETGAWAAIPLGDKDTGPMARLLETFLIENYPALNITTQMIGELRNAVVRAFPRRYDEKRHGLPNFTAFRDGLYNWQTFEFSNHDKEKMAFHSLPLNFPTDVTPTPAFDSFFQKAFPEDQAARDFIPEMIGYYLIPNVREPAAFYLVGKARTGKSTFLDFLADDIVGESFTCAFSLEALTTDKFVPAELAGRRLNVQDEDESEFINADKLKALISQRRIDAQRKFGNPFSFQPRCKFIFGSNQMPNFKQVDDGLKRRLYFLEFNHPLTKAEQDKAMPEKLRAELPGIVYKVVAAARGFMERNQEFVLPESVSTLGDKFALESDPVLLFFAEMYNIHQNPVSAPGTPNTFEWSTSAGMYDQYVNWCQTNRKIPKSSPRFYKSLENIPGLKTERDGNGTRWRSCGLRIIKNDF